MLLKDPGVAWTEHVRLQKWGLAACVVGGCRKKKKKKKLHSGTGLEWLLIRRITNVWGVQRLLSTAVHRSKTNHMCRASFRFGWLPGRTSSAGLSVTASQYHIHWHDPEGRWDIWQCLSRRMWRVSKRERKKKKMMRRLVYVRVAADGGQSPSTSPESVCHTHS